jgi:hypothetical protein
VAVGNHLGESLAKGILNLELPFNQLAVLQVFRVEHLAFRAQCGR